MNCDRPLYWQLRDAPSPDTISFEPQTHVDLYEVVPPCVLTLPTCLSDVAHRDFPGGPFLSLLQLIYEFYQEVVTAEELFRIAGRSPFKRERINRLRERQDAGELIRRLDVVGTSTTYEGIRESVLLVDM